MSRVRQYLWDTWSQSAKRHDFKPPHLAEQKKEEGAASAYRKLWYCFKDLDEELGASLKRGWKHTQLEWRIGLNLAASELLWDRFEKPHVLLNAWVDLARLRLGQSASKVFNAVLRKFCRLGQEQQKTPAYYFPKRLKEIWEGDIGTEPELEAWLEQPPLQFWYSLEDAEWDSEPTVLEPGVSPNEYSKERKGFFQNPSAYRVCQRVVENVEGTVLDFCAAPGTKSFQIARLLGNREKILSWDKNQKRLSKMKSFKDLNMLPSIEIIDHLEEGLKVKSVLVDVPCSNSGVLNKAPEAIEHLWEEKDPFKTIQNEVLEKSLQFLEKGGRLFYTTCSIDRIENENRVKFFEESRKMKCEKMELNKPKANGIHGAFFAYFQL